MASSFGVPRTDLTWTRRPLTPTSFAGLRAAVVGGTGGIGRALAQAMLARGAEVDVVGRTLRDPPVPRLHFIQADLSRMKEAQRVARALPAEQLDLLVLTIGIFGQRARQVTAEGIERDVATSYLSRHVLVRELAGRLGTGRPAGKPRPRIFVMGFPGSAQSPDLEDLNADRGYRWRTAHANGVVGNEALVLDGAHRYPALGFFGLNPGIMKSNIMGGLLGEGSRLHRLQQAVIGLIFPSVAEYAERILPLLISPDIEAASGALFGRFGDPIRTSALLQDAAKVAQAVRASEALAARALAA
jgi:NAD(P)-dependent dehydrogenase (short-subunit alcohol dehydrogenase family)